VVLDPCHDPIFPDGGATNVTLRRNAGRNVTLDRTGGLEAGQRSCGRIASVAHRVTFIRGDGTGPELAEATRGVLEATGVEFDWDWQDAGADTYEQEGTPLPDRVLGSIKASGVAIKAPVTTPVGTGFRSVNVALRKELDLYSCQRPCKAYEGVRTRFPETDIVIIRENHEDLYAGIEFERGSDGALKLEQFLAGMGHPVRDDAGISIKPISVHGTQRIVRSAFEYAKANGRRRVTAAHKANIMKFSDGLFLEVARQVAADEYPDMEFDDRIIDNLCNQLVSRPEEYDVIVLPNLYGDIVSDLGAGMIGGLGMAPGGNIGDACAVFEATHGSAPKYKGQNKVNPSAMLLSGVMMLRHLGEREAADKMEKAIAAVIAQGESVTYDLKPARDDPTAVGTSEMADAVIDRIGAG
jgi:isocitrate dehydrogenase (NAD+)